MYNPHSNDGSCGRGARHHDMPFGHGSGKPPFGMAGHMHGFAGFGGPAGMRARRGDVRSAILRLLSETPMHGYQVIQELSARSGGTWSPSAGSVYPTLQMLADEGLISAQETAGKKVFSLTEAGIAAVAAIADQPAPWEDVARNGAGISDYRDAAGKLLQAAFQIGKDGTSDQRNAAIEIMNDARKKLYAILAED